MVDISTITPMDPDVVDEIESVCGEWGFAPDHPIRRMFLAVCWHETGAQIAAKEPPGSTSGGRRVVVGDGYRTFLGGDYSRSLGVYQSAGPFHVYITLHGPFKADGSPDYAAGFAKWDSVRTTMTYLWGNRWQRNWFDHQGNETYDADPVQWLDDHAKDIQGSLDWTQVQADVANAVSVREHEAWKARQTPPVDYQALYQKYRALYLDELRAKHTAADDDAVRLALRNQDALDKLRTEGEAV